jgi:hypothetical protein
LVEQRIRNAKVEGSTPFTGTIDHQPAEGSIMTLCPIAIVVGCQKCPAFSVCPLKTVIGDMPPKKPEGQSAEPKPKK